MNDRRDSARDEKSAHLVVRASAGTGKTFTLSSRYLKLLHLGASPETILATTFTRKAAGEILSRVLTRLALAAGGDGEAAELSSQLLLKEPMTLDESRRLLATLARSLHRVSISTIDAFFNRVVQCFRFELDVPTGASIVAESDPLAAQLRMDAIEAMLADDDPDTLVGLLRRLHHDTAQRRVTDAIDQIVTSLYDVFRQTDADAWRPFEPPPTLTEDALADALAALQNAVGRNTIKAIAKPLADNLESATARDWTSFVSKGVARKIIDDPAAPRFRNTAIPATLVKVFRPLIDHAHASLVGLIAHRTAAMHDLLQRFDAHDALLRRRHRMMLFSDLPRKLAHDLPKLGDEVMDWLYFRLDDRIGHLLLDEFQDTSVEQWQVLRPIAQEVRSHGDVEHPWQRTFFCVGDVKQAIYGWRGGCAEIFQQVEHDLQLPPSTATMHKSWRSSQVVLDAVDHVFANLADNPVLVDHGEAAAAWSAGYVAHRAIKEQMPGYVELITSRAGDADAPSASGDAGGDDDDASRTPGTHDADVAQRIADLARDCPGRKIGVLTRTNASARLLIDLLRRLNVPASGEGGAPLTDDAAVATVLSALLLADHPGHSAAAFHVVNSPLGPVLALQSIDEAKVEPVSRSIRRALLNDGYAATIASWARSLAASCDARGAERLTRLVELADRYDPAVTLRARDFVRYVQVMAVEEPSSALVRVMTIHKSKGLEFDIVVLTDLDKRIGRAYGQAVWTYRPTPTQSPTAVFAAGKQELIPLVDEHSPLCSQAFEQESRRRLHDDFSALYVAMTRAKHALHMVVPPLAPTRTGKLSTKGLTNLSFASVLRAALSQAEVESFAGGEVLAADGDPHWHARVEPPAAKAAALEAPLDLTLGRHGYAESAELTRAESAGGIGTGKLADSRTRGARAADHAAAADVPGAAARRSWRRISPSAMHNAGRVDPADLLDLSPAARQRGTLVHAWLAMIDWLDGEASLPRDDALFAEAQRIEPDAERRWLREQIAFLHEAVKRPAVAAALAFPQGASRQGDDTPTLWRERAFTVRLDGQLIRGTFDRVVLHRRGGHIASAELFDFKTDRVEPDGANLTALVDGYRPQVDLYRRVLARMTKLEVDDVKASLIFLASGDVRGV